MCRIMDEICKDYAKEIAMKMIAREKLSFEEIAECSSLTLEEVQELAKEMESVNA